MSQESLEFIEHFGKKGMKWGVRRARAVEREKAKIQALNMNRGERKLAKADKEWQKNIYTIKSAVEIHNNVANKMNSGGIDRLNARHPKAHLDHDTPETRAYLKDYENLTAQYTATAVKEVHGTSPSGGFRANLDRSGPDWKVTVSPVEARHAVETIPTLIMELKVENGKVILVKSVREQIMQDSMDPVVFIEHFGKKGMKWGVRTVRKESSDFKKTVPHRGRPTRELTNKQLKSVNERMNLEKNYKKLNPSTISKGHSVAKDLLAAGALAGSMYALYHSQHGKALRKSGERLIRSAIRRLKPSSQLKLF